MVSKTKAERDENREPTLIGVSDSTETISDVDFEEGVTPVPVAVNPVTHAVILKPT